MRSLLTRLLPVLTAFAVFAVSATCTSAGCLLAAPFQQSTSQPACCQGHGHHQHAPAGEKHCPLCQNATLIAKTVEKNSPHQVTGGLHLLQAFLAIGFWTSDCVVSRSLIDFPPQHLPSTSPPTLLALHCSLIV